MPQLKVSLLKGKECHVWRGAQRGEIWGRSRETASYGDEMRRGQVAPVCTLGHRKGVAHPSSVTHRPPPWQVWAQSMMWTCPKALKPHPGTQGPSGGRCPQETPRDLVRGGVNRMGPRGGSCIQAMESGQVSSTERVGVWMRKVWAPEGPTMNLGGAGDAISGA